jgi:hypothetical protein
MSWGKVEQEQYFKHGFQERIPYIMSIQFLGRIVVYVKIIKKYLGKCFSSPRCLRGEKVPNVEPSHLICGT